MRVTEAQMREYIRLAHQRATAMTGKPIHLVLTGYHATAATDCQRTVLFNPRPFEEGNSQVGLGIISHECGHIYSSTSYGASLMAQARAEGGEPLATIVNLILDRKDDTIVRSDFPGIKADLNARMPYICPSPKDDDELVAHRGRRKRRAFYDFFYACKAFATPKHPAVWKAMKIVSKALRNLRGVTKDEILEAARKVLRILEAASPEDNQILQRLYRNDHSTLLKRMEQQEEGANTLTPGEREELTKLIAQVEAEIDQETFPLRSDNVPSGQPLPKTGEVGRPQFEPEEHDYPTAPSEFQAVLAAVQHLVAPLRARLEVLAPPQVWTRRGLEEGDLDSTQFVAAALGRTDVLKITETRSDHTTVALALDTSGSMALGVDAEGRGQKKIEYGRQIGVVFNAALIGLECTTTRCWSYSDTISDHGPARLDSGIAAVNPGGYNCDSAMAKRLAKYFGDNPGERMVAIFISDGGPDSYEVLQENLHALNQMGVTTVQFFIERADERLSDAKEKLRQMFDYQFVFDADSIDKIVLEFAQLMVGIYDDRRD